MKRLQVTAQLDPSSRPRESAFGDQQVMTQLEMSVRADQDELERLLDMLAPIAGSIWLATDLTTLVHWTINAGSIAPVLDPLEGRFCRATGLATICAPDGEHVFLINERDTIQWIEPERSLAIRELGEASCEIRLERLDDLDVRLIDAFNLQHHATETPSLRTLSVGNNRYLQVYDDQLPTGNPEVDAVLRTIEATIAARRSLFGPSAGTLDVMDQMAQQLVQTLKANVVESYVWAAILQEQIEGMRHLLAA